MVSTYSVTDSTGLVHFFCDHHSLKETVLHSETVASKNTIRNFLPIIGIYSLVFIITLLTMAITGNWSLHYGMLVMMGLTFLFFGYFKIIDVTAFADGYSTYDIIAMKSRLYALSYPFIELVLAGLYLSDTGGIYRDIFTLILMLIGSIGVFKKLQLKEEIPCVCLGVIFKLPMTNVTLFENLFMALMALVMIPMYFYM